MSPAEPTFSPASANAPIAAVTGATGFIGRQLVPVLARAGWRVRLLLRRDPVTPEWRHLRPEIVPGALGDGAALSRLVEDATAVIHAAGLIKATSRRRFLEINRDGVAAIAGATRRLAPQAHFMLISSLAAREPQLSDYAASKRAGETVARETLGPRLTVLRPPAVYGPGDRESLRLFRLARQRLIPLLGSPDSRSALIHVHDLARLIVALAGTVPSGGVYAAADARPEGYRWDELLAAAARAVGNQAPRLVRAPGVLLRATALAGDLAGLLGAASLVNSQKLRELRHPDWSVAPAELAHVAGWAPAFDLDAGFADTVAWYRNAGWLPA